MRCVIFDIGRTLIPFSLDPLQPAVAHCRREFSDLAARYETGRVSIPEFRDRLAALTGLRGAAMDAWWNSIFQDRWLIPPAWIRSLRPRWRVGLLSNTNATHFAFLRGRLEELGRFDFAVLSHEVGAAKPDPAIYAAAEAAAACPPGEIAYWDDVPEFVAAARVRGWQAAEFRGWERMRCLDWVAASLDATAASL